MRLWVYRSRDPSHLSNSSLFCTFYHCHQIDIFKSTLLFAYWLLLIDLFQWVLFIGILIWIVSLLAYVIATSLKISLYSNIIEITNQSLTKCRQAGQMPFGAVFWLSIAHNKMHGLPDTVEPGFLRIRQLQSNCH